MTVGDLVQYCGEQYEACERNLGVILRFDLMRHESGPPTPIVEVLWKNEKSWIARSRVRCVNKNQRETFK